MEGSATAELLDAVVALDLDELDIELPKGFGRDETGHRLDRARRLGNPGREDGLYGDFWSDSGGPYRPSGGL